MLLQRHSTLIATSDLEHPPSLAERYSVLQEELGSSADRQWHCVLGCSRTWGVDEKARSLFSPAYLMLAVSSADSRGAGQPATLFRAAMIPLSRASGSAFRTDLISKHLMRSNAVLREKLSTADAVGDPTEAAAEAAAWEVRTLWDSLPEGLRPLDGATITCIPSVTHETIGLMSAERFMCSVQRRLQGAGIPAVVAKEASQFDAAAVLQWCEAEAHEGGLLRWPAFTSKRSHPVSLHKSTAWRNLIADALRHQQSLPRIAMLQPEAFEGKWESDGDVPPQRPASFAAKTLEGGDVVTRPHVSVVQPTLSERTLSPDGVVLGPVVPSQQTPVLYFHRDAGDILFAYDGLMRTKVPPQSYDELLPTDEFCLQVRYEPMEWLSFDAIDVVLEMLEQVAGAASEDRVEGTGRRWLMGSNAGFSGKADLIVPVLQLMRATGSSHRPTPVSNPVMEVELNPLVTDDDVMLVLAAQQWMRSKITVQRSASSFGSLQAQVSLLPPSRDYCALPGDETAAFLASLTTTHGPLQTCRWCGRKRVSMSRCGGCKVATYCCKGHQANDWKQGPHKGECTKWKEAYRVEVEEVSAIEALPPVGSRSRWPEESADWEVITAAFHYLRPQRMSQSRRVDSTPLMHVVGFEGDVDAWLREPAAGGDVARRLLAAVQENGWHAPQQLTAAPTLVRVVLFCESRSLPDARRNEVWRVLADAPAELLPPTGIPGDVWRTGNCHRESVVANGIIVRLTNERYHNFLAQSAALLGCDSLEDAAPDALIVLGDTQGSGLSYFNGVSDIITDEFVTLRVPAIISDANLVAAQRSLHTITQRLTSTSKSRDASTVAKQWCSLKPIVNVEAVRRTARQCQSGGVVNKSLDVTRKHSFLTLLTYS